MSPDSLKRVEVREVKPHAPFLPPGECGHHARVPEFPLVSSLAYHTLLVPLPGTGGPKSVHKMPLPSPECCWGLGSAAS